VKIYRIIISAGRENYLQQTARSVFGLDNPEGHGYMTPDVRGTIVSDDSQNPEFAEWLDQNFSGGNCIIGHHKEKLGMCGCVDWAWKNIPDECEFVQHLEDDFILEAPVDLTQLAFVLHRVKWISQLWLMRQPWYPTEREAGGIYRLRGPNNWSVRSVNGPDGWPLYWTEYATGRFWTHNPSLYRYDIVKQCLKENGSYFNGPFCEEQMAQWTWDHGLRSAFWGRPDETHRVKHIGVHCSKKPLY